jgi:hypothetical protein
MQNNESSGKSAKEIVMEFIEALDRKDFKTVRSYISDNISYVSPFNSLVGAEPYLKYLEHANLPKLNIKKEFVDSNDVCIFHEYKVGKPPVTSLVCTWVHVNNDGKISSIRAVLDPRPYLQQNKK